MTSSASRWKHLAAAVYELRNSYEKRKPIVRLCERTRDLDVDAIYQIQELDVEPRLIWGRRLNDNASSSLFVLDGRPTWLFT